ncbi:uncharacterized protein LOC125146069 [Tachysurus fulvidraco]|uniref:uncharacterized protein LOC125146069 n=1 Tax=Tachysurus fulvidraco TaxID=1234273 RepID=UPI001FF0469E|nr:uncharacterized protein LOC125146069 [Tachysurus fulvidraco]
MGVEDILYNELVKWMEKQEECAEHLMKLAKELEKMTEVMTAGQLVGNTAAVVGSAVLFGAGIATFLTGGLAAPLLATVAGVTAGVGTVTSVTCKILECWKSSETMKNAEKTAGEVEKIWKHIESLQEQLSEECELTNDFNEVQCEITARILRAMAKRNGRDLPQSRLTYLLGNDHTYFHTHQSFVPSEGLFKGVGNLLAFIGFTEIFLKTAAKKGAKYVPLILTTEGMAAIALKAVVKGTGQVAGGALGLVLSLPDLIDNCEKLIKNKHQTEASKYLRNKACEIRDAVKKIKKQLTELQEMLNEIPEIEIHIDLATEMCGNQRYTRGTISVESKKTKKHDGNKKEFILISTKVMCETKTGDKSKQKSAVNSNNKRLKGNEEKRKEEERRKKEFRLPTITMSNVRSLSNKMKEIKEKLKNDEFFASDVMFFTETWLKNNSSPIDVDGYTSYRVDRDAVLTQKNRGGGMIMLVKQDWASDVTVRYTDNTPDYEVMDVSIKPHDHPQDDPPLTFIHVYIPGPNFDKAAADITRIYCNALARSGYGRVFLLGDFNRCNITTLIDYLLCQYITCPTRRNNTLDRCYGHVPGAYRSVCRPPLGRSDHNVIHLIPKDQNDPPKYGECKHDHTKPSKQ